MKLDLNTEQLEFLQFIIDNFEYNDDEEKKTIRLNRVSTI